MIVWGGDGGTRLLGGGRFNPQTNTWQSLNLTNGPQSSVAHTAVWTGSEMIVWGGQESTRAADINTGARYNPQTDSWVPATNPQNGGARNEHPAVWTGAEMIIWGSYTHQSTPTNTGARYYPATDTWLPTSMINVPHQRYAPLGVWSGSEFVVWGGCQDPFCFTRFNTGGRYNPSTDTWRETSTVNAAEARYWFSAVWTGSEMLVWGGCDAQTCGPGGNSDRNGLNNGGRYNPQTDSWQPVSLTGAPSGRWFHAAVWTGSEMIVWAGEDGNVGPHNDGARYNPTTNTWTPTTLTNAPTARNHANAVWTGNRMMAWGGDNSLLDQDLNNGGLYNPATDSWTATSQTNAPSARVGYSLVWTGSEVIVFGGCSGVNCQTDTNTGGRFNPNTNTWRATSTFEAPSARDVHSAVFTGSEMIVFGGESCARCEPILDTGGRYGVAAPAVATGAVSRKTHGSAGTFDVALPMTGRPGIESRSGGATGDHQIVVTFNTSVSVSGSPQAQVTSGSGQVANGGAVTVTGNTVTVPLTNVTDAQTLTVMLSGVNNGNGAVNVTVPISFLLGDTNSNGLVNATDVGLTKSQSGIAVSASNFRSDVNAGGTVNATDVGQVKANSGHGL
jgi:N-acetylneuraminic acid mutarotase